MAKICNDRIGDDKKMHAIVSLIIGMVFAGIFSVVNFGSPIWAAVVTFGIVMFIGIAKEVFDSREDNNHFCVWDLLADAIGGFIAAIIAFLANYFTW